jgi:hypothetical protein
VRPKRWPHAAHPSAWLASATTHLSGFLLRRFAETSGKRKGLVWRLDTKTGQPRAVAPKYEAALPHYYRLEYEDGTTDSRPEDLLARIEDATASALERIERGELPGDEDRAWLALFVSYSTAARRRLERCSGSATS